MSDDLPNSIFDKIVNLYREAVKQLPALKYSWGLIAIICILALIDFFKLGNTEVVFRSVVLALGIIFLIFIFSFLTKTNDKVIRSGLYILTYSIILTLTALVIGFAIHTLTPFKFSFYENLLNASGSAKTGDSALNKHDTSLSKLKGSKTSQDTQQIKENDTIAHHIQIKEQHSVPPSRKSSNGNRNKQTENESAKGSTEVPAIPMCTASCDTKGVVGVELSFTDPKNNKKYKFTSNGVELEFQIPCYLLDQTVSVTFKKEGKSDDYRNVRLKEFEIPDKFK